MPPKSKNAEPAAAAEETEEKEAAPQWVPDVARFQFPDSSTYEGDILRSDKETYKMHGTGICQTGPEMFEGTYNDDKYEKGTYRFASGAVYEGTWAKNSFHGQGTYTWPDGKKFVGLWRYGLMHGPGEFHKFSPGAKEVFEGYAVNGKFKSSYMEQVEAKTMFTEMYARDCQKGAKAALRELDVGLNGDALSQQLNSASEFFVIAPEKPEKGEDEEEEPPTPVAEMEFLDGPFPTPDDAKAHLAAILEGFDPEAEEESRTTVKVPMEASDSLLDGRLRFPLGRYTVQSVEFTRPDKEVSIVLLNASESYDLEKAQWTVVLVKEADA